MIIIAVDLLCGVAPVAHAEPIDRFRVPPDKATDRPPKPPRANAANPCLAYGEGFARVEGTDTCIKIGGSIAIGGSINGGSRSR